MDIFKERYFSFNRKLLVSLGLWPFGSGTKNIRKYVIPSAQFVLSIPQVISVIINFSDIDRAMLNVTIILCAIILFGKMVCMLIAADKMKGLYKDIADNWDAITDEKEKEILIKCTERGRMKAIIYFVMLQACIGGVYALPMIPKLLDLINPQDQPRPKIYILEGEMFLDRNEYYKVYYLWDAVTVIINAYTCVSVDAMFMVCVEHCCALYEIISYRLHNLSTGTSDDSTEDATSSYEHVTGIIELHQKVLEFTETINAAFSLSFLTISLLNIAIIPLVAVLIIITLGQLFNCLRFVLFFSVLAFHMFMLYWPGQNILNHCDTLINDAYCNEWYTTPLRTRKIIVVFMIRCTQPAFLTAGGLLPINFETYSAIMRTAVSYITVAASFR